jgi:hypothetical protein
MRGRTQTSVMGTIPGRSCGEGRDDPRDRTTGRQESPLPAFAERSACDKVPVFAPTLIRPPSLRMPVRVVHHEVRRLRLRLALAALPLGPCDVTDLGDLAK